MTLLTSLDSQVRTRLQGWPQRPPGLVGMRGKGHWLRARPTPACDGTLPFLKLPGSTHWRTLPDGLWLEFGGSPSEAYVDVFAIEACSTISNLLDKRSRFAPSTQSLMAVCPMAWLLAPSDPDDETERWQLTGILKEPPTGPLILPVRDVRVVYALKKREYRGFASSQIPHPHEYFVPMEALVADRSDEDPAMRALFKRAQASANFLEFT